jgi:uncharacterized protein YcbK (DUF882 family)
MGDLSRDFSTREFTCHCGCGLAQMSYLLIDALQELRDALGCPIYISSGYRCSAHNRRVGGSRNSQHMLGKAADIKVARYPLPFIYTEVEKVALFKRGGVGLYQEFLHLDVRGKRVRWQIPSTPKQEWFP